MNAKNNQNQELYEALMYCYSAQEVEKFLHDLCTPAELAALSERWAIARLLNDKKSSYREISRLTGASTTTIGRVARFLSQEPHKGYHIVLDRIKSESGTDNKKSRAA